MRRLFIMLILLFGCTAQLPEEKGNLPMADISLVNEDAHNVSFKFNAVNSDYLLHLTLLDKENNPTKSKNVSVAITVIDEEGLLYFERRFVPFFNETYSLSVPSKKIKNSFYSEGTINISLSSNKQISVVSKIPLNKYSADEARQVEEKNYLNTAKSFSQTFDTECLRISPEKYGYYNFHSLDKMTRYFRVDLTVQNICETTYSFTPDTIWLRDSSNNYFPPTYKGSLSSFLLSKNNSGSGYMLYNLFKRNPNSIRLYFKDYLVTDLKIR